MCSEKSLYEHTNDISSNIRGIIDPSKLLHCGRSITSQFGDDGIIFCLAKFFQSLINHHPVAIEIGAHETESNFHWLWKCHRDDWKVIRFDPTMNRPDLRLYPIGVKTGSLKSILSKMVHTVDFFSVDIDSYDISLVSDLLKLFSPVLIIGEYNKYFPRNQRYRTPNNQYIRFHCDICYGNSFAEWKNFFDKHGGYKLVHIEGNTNLYWVKKEYVKNGLNELSPTVQNCCNQRLDNYAELAGKINWKEYNKKRIYHCKDISIFAKMKYSRYVNYNSLYKTWCDKNPSETFEYIDFGIIVPINKSKKRLMEIYNIKVNSEGQYTEGFKDWVNKNLKNNY